jgi:hypothetical protein
MNTDREPTAHQQHRLLQQWVTSLSQRSEVEVIWLEGSLADDRANPWSDIDLRLGIADSAYEQLWDKESVSLLEGLGEHLVLWSAGFVRAVTAEGVVVELGAVRSSELAAQELYEWKFLLNRRAGAPPTFKKLPERSTAETWPAPAVLVEDVHQHTNTMIHLMATAPSDFYNGEVCAAAYTLDYLRNVLFRIMYQRLGIRFSKRAKELSQIFPADFLTDLQGTYTREGESALDLTAIAAAQIRTFGALGKHLHGWSDQTGGGFEPVWYQRLFERLKDDLHSLANQGLQASQNRDV